jgi:hypothetical protein
MADHPGTFALPTIGERVVYGDDVLTVKGVRCSMHEQRDHEDRPKLVLHFDIHAEWAADGYTEPDPLL